MWRLTIIFIFMLISFNVTGNNILIYRSIIEKLESDKSLKRVLSTFKGVSKIGKDTISLKVSPVVRTKLPGLNTDDFREIYFDSRLLSLNNSKRKLSNYTIYFATPKDSIVRFTITKSFPVIREKVYLFSNDRDRIEGKVFFYGKQLKSIEYSFVKSYVDPTSFISMVKPDMQAVKECLLWIHNNEIILESDSSSLSLSQILARHGMKKKQIIGKVAKGITIDMTISHFFLDKGKVVFWMCLKENKISTLYACNISKYGFIYYKLFDENSFFERDLCERLGLSLLDIPIPDCN